MQRDLHTNLLNPEVGNFGEKLDKFTHFAANLPP